MCEHLDTKLKPFRSKQQTEKHKSSLEEGSSENTGEGKQDSWKKKKCHQWREEDFQTFQRHRAEAVNTPSLPSCFLPDARTLPRDLRSCGWLSVFSSITHI